jgi:hypothetical protein
MTTQKRTRGRPRGSGKDDSPYLARVAQLLLRDPSLRPTTAMKRVLATRKDWGVSDETLLRRWQVKWKAQGQALIAAQRESLPPMGLVWPGRDAGAPHADEGPRAGAWGKGPPGGASHPPRLRPNQATRQHDSRYRGW